MPDTFGPIEISHEARLVATNRVHSHVGRLGVVDGISEQLDVHGSVGTAEADHTYHVTVAWQHLRGTTMIGSSHDLEARLAVFDTEKSAEVADVLIDTTEVPTDHDSRIRRIVSAFGSTIRFVVERGNAQEMPYKLTVSDR